MAHAPRRYLGIETSCDDTCAAVVTAEGEILSSAISSQSRFHERYGEWSRKWPRGTISSSSTPSSKTRSTARIRGSMG